MSKTLTLQSADGILARNDIGHALLVVGTTVPTDTHPGYATGCLFMKSNGSAGTALYCNEGTSASCDFDAVSVA